MVLELFNILDAKVSDIDDLYASRLAGSRLKASKMFTRIRRFRARPEWLSTSRSERSSG
jgi:hypothetical protein